MESYECSRFSLKVFQTLDPGLSVIYEVSNDSYCVWHSCWSNKWFRKSVVLLDFFMILSYDSGALLNSPRPPASARRSE